MILVYCSTWFLLLFLLKDKEISVSVADRLYLDQEKIRQESDMYFSGWAKAKKCFGRDQQPIPACCCCFFVLFFQCQHKDLTPILSETTGGSLRMQKCWCRTKKKASSSTVSLSIKRFPRCVVSVWFCQDEWMGRRWHGEWWERRCERIEGLRQRLGQTLYQNRDIYCMKEPESPSRDGRVWEEEKRGDAALRWVWRSAEVKEKEITDGKRDRVWRRGQTEAEDGVIERSRTWL